MLTRYVVDEKYEDYSGKNLPISFQALHDADLVVAATMERSELDCDRDDLGCNLIIHNCIRAVVTDELLALGLTDAKRSAVELRDQEDE